VVHAKSVRKPCGFLRWDLVTLNASDKTRVDFRNAVGDVGERRLGVARGGLRERCLLVLNSVTSTPQWIRK
jgi:hypothetical protein